MITGSIYGLTTSNLVEVMEARYSSDSKVYVDVGDGQLRLVEMINGDEINGKRVVILRALM